MNHIAPLRDSVGMPKMAVPWALPFAPWTREPARTTIRTKFDALRDLTEHAE
jgi:hypothetical protein